MTKDLIAHRALRILDSRDGIRWSQKISAVNPDTVVKGILGVVDAFNQAEAELQKEETQALADRYSGQA